MKSVTGREIFSRLGRWSRHPPAETQSGAAVACGIPLLANGEAPAIIVVVALLSLRSGSGDDEVTIAVLLIAVPAATLSLILTIRLAPVTDPKPGIEEKLIVRLLPAPPHTPLLPGKQNHRVVSGGRLSLTRTDAASVGNGFVTSRA
jgi:hypothetical protein